MIAMSAAFMLSGAPFDGPVAGLRIGLKDGKPQAFMSLGEMTSNDLDLVIAGTEHAIMMVEAGANEVSEEQVADALAWGHQALQPAIAIQKELMQKAGVTPKEYSLSLPSEDVQKEVDAFLAGKMGDKLRAPMAERHTRMHELRQSLLTHFAEQRGEDWEKVKRDYEDAFATAANKDVRKGILEDGVRPDGDRKSVV